MKAIKELESELGISIFKRTAKGVEPTRQGAEFLERPVSFCVTRADMDNDMYNRIFWRGCGLYDAYATGGEIQLTDGGFRQKIALQAMWRKNIAEIWAEYRFFDSGFILRLSAEIGAHIRFLPRFGLLA